MPKLKTADPVWATIMVRDFEKIKEILRGTNPDSYPAIANAAEIIADIVDVYIGENLENFKEPTDY